MEPSEPSDSSSGGRVTLRLSASANDHVEYSGEMVTSEGTWSARATVSVADGSIALAHDGSEPPAWLVSVARSALRVAWRASRAGTPWPRRINRWRPGPDAEDTE